jgi:hypothetical protein
MEKAKGVIEKVWDNAHGSTPYKVIVLEGGDRYACWDKGKFGSLVEGEEIAFDYKISGKGYKNIDTIYDGSEPEEATPGNGNGREAGSGGNGGGFEGDAQKFTGDRLDRMVRMSGLKSAAQIVAGCGTKMPFETKVDKTLEAARKFSNYINDDEFEPDTVESAEMA